MRIGVPIWNGRVSPVLDAAEQMLVVEIGTGGSTTRRAVLLSPRSLPAQAARIGELSLDTLVCGAVSRVLAEMLESSGLRLVPWVAGDLEEVLSAVETGELGNRRYSMPGCCGRRGRARHGRRKQSQMGRRARRSE
jgi:predicted Fe-Mo cluster-binding NifX family protein